MARIAIVIALLCTTAALAAQVNPNRLLDDLQNTKTRNEADHLNQVAKSFDLLDKIRLPPGPKSQTFMTFLHQLGETLVPLTNEEMSKWYVLLRSIAGRLNHLMQADNTVTCAVEKFDVMKKAVSYLIENGRKCVKIPFDSFSSLDEFGQLAPRDVLSNVLVTLEEVKSCYASRDAVCTLTSAVKFLSAVQLLFENARGLLANTVSLLAEPSIQTITCLRTSLKWFSDELQITDKFKEMCMSKT